MSGSKAPHHEASDGTASSGTITVTDGAFAADVMIPNKKGLHARASAQFVRTAGDYKASVKVSREGQTVGGTSIMGLMMLAAGQGHSIHIEASGEDAANAIKALVALVENGFGEED